MVKIALAGGTGQVAREVLDVLLASKRHDITILSRQGSPAAAKTPDVRWQIVDYNDKNSLVGALRGIHTVLSFVQLLSDPDQKSQKNLIDASISAGVKRFAPSEYASKEIVDMVWSQGKESIREYLREINANENLLEYTLFQPGIFLDYLAFPYKTSKYIQPLQTVFDFQNRRAMVVAGHEDAIMTFTTVADLVAIIDRAVDYTGKWPVVGGISGNRLTFSELIEIGERVRGSSFAVDKVVVEDLEAGELETSWSLQAIHKAVPKEQASALLKAVSVGILLSSTKGAWDSSDEMNRLFPDYEFSRAEDFLAKVWKDKL